MTSTSTEPSKASSGVGKVVASAFAGTAMEWYDYFVYGTASALVFGKLFFAEGDPAVATLLSLLTFAAGFVARPLGALIFGQIGDRLGRRTATVGSIFLMGIATGIIGLLPGYATAGILAPLCLVLLRLCQGVSAGGEWSGAMTLVLEHTPKAKQGFMSAIPQMGSPAATLLSTGVLSIVSLMPDDLFFSWGWRIPFLLAFPFLGIGLYLRSRVEESPEFKKLQANEEIVKVPVASAIRHTGGRMILGGMAALLGGSGFFMITTFGVGYGVDQIGYERQEMLNATLWGALAQFIVCLIGGRLADRFGAWKIVAAGGIITMILAFPIFALIDSGNVGLMTLGIIMGMASLTIPYGPIGAMMSGLFPAKYRYSAMAVSYNVFGLVGGFLPVLSQTLLIGADMKSWGVALLLIAVALATTVGAIGAGSSIVRRRRAAEDAEERELELAKSV
ncbi:MFS transporter [Leucobacter sp. USHLN153]|uniref:MFS transporter n=1 Tax=Leucobacter sp. USHLN153 TaxID=3081268 RepID=UPI00301B4E4E